MLFTHEQFLSVFVSCNRALWPLQPIAAALALAAAAATQAFPRCPRWLNRAVSGLLAALWLLTGVGFHALHFSAITPAAWLFAAANLVAAALFFEAGVLRDGMQFGRVQGKRGVAGMLIVLYGVVLYPLIGVLLGRTFPATPVFGLPCPTTIFTLGMLLLARPQPPRRTWLIPVVWSFVVLFAAVRMGIYEDYGLTLAGVVVLAAFGTRLAGAGADPDC